MTEKSPNIMNRSLAHTSLRDDIQKIGHKMKTDEKVKKLKNSYAGVWCMYRCTIHDSGVWSTQSQY